MNAFIGSLVTYGWVTESDNKPRRINSVGKGKNLKAMVTLDLATSRKEGPIGRATDVSSELNGGDVTEYIIRNKGFPEVPNEGNAVLPSALEQLPIRTTQPRLSRSRVLERLLGGEIR